MPTTRRYLPVLSHREILVAEDDEEIRETIASLLRHRGFQVTTAKDEAAAWQIFRKHPVSVVLMDLLMPEVDGRELARRIKNAYAETFILLITGGDPPAAYSLYREGLVDKVLIKPCGIKEIVTIFHKAGQSLKGSK
ncbi:MAG TPA: response regulator [Desulfobacterales bacterium]